MHSAIYFWKGKQVHLYEGDNTLDTVLETEFDNCYSVDTSTSDPDLRYGKYLNSGWEHFPIEEFPKDFRTNLLLLGIT